VLTTAHLQHNQTPIHRRPDTSPSFSPEYITLVSLLDSPNKHLKRHYRLLYSSLHTHDKPFECTDYGSSTTTTYMFDIRVGVEVAYLMNPLSATRVE
jgi:hypothetical protein